MQTVTDSYAHVLLFACPQCGTPLASACASTRKNLEVADAHWFNPRCSCGWTGQVIGIEAVKHWVEPWKLPVNVGPDVASSCDGEPLISTQKVDVFRSRTGRRKSSEDSELSYDN